MAKRKTLLEFETQTGRAISGVARFALGGMSMVVGLLFMGAALNGAVDIGSLKKLPSGDHLLVLYVVVPLGGFMFAFGRALLGFNEVEDERLLERMTPRERGEQAFRLATRHQAPLRFWAGSSALLFVLMDVALWRLLLQPRVELWFERLVIVGVTAGVLWIARQVFRRRLPIHARKAALPATGEEKRVVGWVSQNQWTLEEPVTTRFAVLVPGALAVALIGAVVVQQLTVGSFESGDLASAFVFLALAAFAFREWKRRKTPAVLELTRVRDRPLVLRGRLTFGGSFKPETEICYVRFRAARVRSIDPDIAWWLETTAPLEVAEDRATAAFLLRAEIPESLPHFSAYNAWTIALMQAGAKDPIMIFALPREVIYLEEFPA